MALFEIFLEIYQVSGSIYISNSVMEGIRVLAHRLSAYKRTGMNETIPLPIITCPVVQFSALCGVAKYFRILFCTFHKYFVALLNHRISKR